MSRREDGSKSKSHLRDECEFAEKDGTTGLYQTDRVSGKKKFIALLNCTIKVTKVVTGEADYEGGVLTALTHQYDEEERACYIPNSSIRNQDAFEKALNCGVTRNYTFICHFHKKQLKDFMQWLIHRYISRSSVENRRASRVTTVGLQSCKTVFVFNESTQLKRLTGEEYKNTPYLWLNTKEGGLSLMRCNVNKPLQKGSDLIRALFRMLESTVTSNTFLAAVLALGDVLRAVHYTTFLELFNRVPVPLYVGDLNTGKSFICKVALSVLGLHETGVVKDCSEAATRLLNSSVMSLPYLLNDPADPTIVQAINMRCFERGLSINAYGMEAARTFPLISANEFLANGLKSIHGLREIHRNVLVPMTDPMTRRSVKENTEINRLMDAASNSIQSVVTMEKKLRKDSCLDEYEEINSSVCALLDMPQMERVAANYAQQIYSGHLAAKYLLKMNLKVELLEFFEVQMLEAINRHQKMNVGPSEFDTLKFFNSLVEVAKEIVHNELSCYMRLVQHHFNGVRKSCISISWKEVMVEMKKNDVDLVENALRSHLRQQGKECYSTGHMWFGSKGATRGNGLIDRAAVFLSRDIIPDDIFAEIESLINGDEDETNQVESSDSEADRPLRRRPAISQRVSSSSEDSVNVINGDEDETNQVESSDSEADRPLRRRRIISRRLSSSSEDSVNENDSEHAEGGDNSLLHRDESDTDEDQVDVLSKHMQDLLERKGITVESSCQQSESKTRTTTPKKHASGSIKEGKRDRPKRIRKTLKQRDFVY